MRRLLTLLVGVLLAAPALFGTDLSGIWFGEIQSRLGPQNIIFKFVQNGTTLAGKLYGDYGSTPIVEGVISRDQIVFVVITREQAGNQINESRLRFSGCFTDREIELVRERERSTDAVSGAHVVVRNRGGQPSQVISLKRLL